MLKWITVNMSCFMVEPLFFHIPEPINTLMHVVYYLTKHLHDPDCNSIFSERKKRTEVGKKRKKNYNDFSHFAQMMPSYRKTKIISFPFGIKLG